MSSDYQPVFGSVPEDPSARWALIREFVRRWHGAVLGPVARTSPLVADEESKLGFPLPSALREWISFAEELIAQGIFGRVLRDGYCVSLLEEQDAVSLMLQGEGDLYWAIPCSEL